jgi:curved DNA-binding protein CbpA
MPKDYYSILGVSSNATPQEIKTAYRKLALKFHPDKNPGDPYFEQRFRDIKDAYEILFKKHQRKTYYENKEQKNHHNQQNEFRSKHTYEEPNTNDELNEYFNKILMELVGIKSKMKDALKNANNSTELKSYLNKILSSQILKHYKNIPNNLRKQIIFNIISLLEYVEDKNRDKYVILLVSIAESDNFLISRIYARVELLRSKERKQKRSEYALHIGIISGLIILFALIYFSIINFDFESNNSKEENYHNLPSEEIKKVPSKWKNNQLKTGDSPYNNYFISSEGRLW